jgi:hypothetical protein
MYIYMYMYIYASYTILQQGKERNLTAAAADFTVV